VIKTISPSFLPSPIYCYGELLAAVQTAAIFNDSKEYVDRPLTADVSEVLDAFSSLPVNVSSSDLREFVLNWTTAAGSDIEPWTPTDWIQRSAQ
jgi:alpha,alpha-trehalase